MKIELSIKASYFPEWGLWEGLREILSNGRDAETELQAPLSVKLRREAEILVVENEGAVLPHEALLLGHTTKRENSNLIGRFGEGLKGGVLALVRAGHDVKIRSGSEVWIPSIRQSEKFKADVLTFDIQKGRKDEKRVAVEIGGITQDIWASMQDRFLFLKGQLNDTNHVGCYSGNLLLGDVLKGKVFVKGIFVNNDPKLSYGYDFKEAELDRDRKMLSKWDMNYKTQSIWREALGRRPDLISDFGKLLESQASDVEGVDEWNAQYLPEAARKELVRVFQERHGVDALPVSSLAESAEIEHLGKRGVVVPKGLRLILERDLGNVASNKAKLREEVTQTYSWHDITDAEKANINRAIDLINPVESMSLNLLDITDFRDDNIRGMFKDGRILLARKILEDRSLTLRVMVHEVAHRTGGDGEKSHVSNIERIWAGIVQGLSA